MDIKSGGTDWWTAIVRDGELLRVFPMQYIAPEADVNGVLYRLTAVCLEKRTLLFERSK